MQTNIITGSDSSILYAILPRLSPTRLNSRNTPAPDNAEVLVARGKSLSTSRKSTKLGSVWRSGCLPTPFKNLSFPHKMTCAQCKPITCTSVICRMLMHGRSWLYDCTITWFVQTYVAVRPVFDVLCNLPLWSHTFDRMDTGCTTGGTTTEDLPTTEKIHQKTSHGQPLFTAWLVSGSHR